MFCWYNVVLRPSLYSILVAIAAKWQGDHVILRPLANTLLAYSVYTQSKIECSNWVDVSKRKEGRQRVPAMFSAVGSRTVLWMER